MIWFHGTLISKWTVQREIDPLFGTGARKADIDMNLMPNVVKAVTDGRLKPYEDAKHAQMCQVLINGTYTAFRGGEEHAKLAMASQNVGPRRHLAIDHH